MDRYQFTLFVMIGTRISRRREMITRAIIDRILQFLLRIFCYRSYARCQKSKALSWSQARCTFQAIALVAQLLHLSRIVSHFGQVFYRSCLGLTYRELLLLKFAALLPQFSQSSSSSQNSCKSLQPEIAYAIAEQTVQPPTYIWFLFERGAEHQQMISELIERRIDVSFRVIGAAKRNVNSIVIVLLGMPAAEMGLDLLPLINSQPKQFQLSQHLCQRSGVLLLPRS